MKTTIILSTKKLDYRTVRFSTENAPSLLVGDTFTLPLMTNLGVATVEKRHWLGQELFIFCAAPYVLLSDLIENAKKMQCRVDDYELPNQDWSEPFPE